MSYISQSQANKRLCKDCTHCVTTYPDLSAPRYMCGLKRDSVDDSPTATCHWARFNPLICGGRKWELDKDITICETEEAARTADREAQIEAFVPTARAHIEAGTEPMATCGFYELARERVLTSMSKSVTLT